MFRRRGECESGEQAVDWVRRNPAAFSLVLMDVNMDGMDGYEAVRRIRRLTDGGSRPRVLSISVTDDDDDLRREAGFDGHVRKDQLNASADLARHWFPDRNWGQVEAGGGGGERREVGGGGKSDTGWVPSGRDRMSDTEWVARLALLATLARTPDGRFRDRLERLCHQLKQGSPPDGWAALLKPTDDETYRQLLEQALNAALAAAVDRLTFARD